MGHGAKAAPAPAPGVQGSALATVPLFGGNRGGRKRSDGLAPGSPAAVEADRKKDAERKRQQRASAAKAVEPPPLPPAGQGAPGQSSAPSGDPSVDLGAALAAENIPWDPELLKPLIEEAIESTEKAKLTEFRDLAMRARLQKELVAQILNDARYTPAFKSTVKLTAPRAIAKLLNQTGISGKYSDEALCGLSILALWFQGRRQKATLEELIQQKPEGGTPPGATVKAGAASSSSAPPVVLPDPAPPKGAPPTVA